MLVNKQLESIVAKVFGCTSIARCYYKRPMGRLGGAHAKISESGDITRIEPRVVSGSVHKVIKSESPCIT